MKEPYEIGEKRLHLVGIGYRIDAQFVRVPRRPHMGHIAVIEQDTNSTSNAHMVGPIECCAVCYASSNVRLSTAAALDAGSTMGNG
jgi:hypothetical protein